MCQGGGGAIWHAVHRVPLHWSAQIGPCSSLAVSPDERTLAVGTPDGQVHLRDTSTGRLRGRYRWQATPVVQVAFSPDGRTLAAATAEGQVREMDAAVEHSPDGLQTVTMNGVSPCWSPDGRTLAVSAQGGTVRLLDRGSGEQRLVLRCPAAEVRCLAFSRDGRTLATGCFGERVVRLWDAADGRLRAVTAPEGTEASALAFSPDGRRLAAAVGGRVRFWDATTGAAGDALEAGQPVEDLAFTPDGRALLTAGPTLQAWNLGDNGSSPRKPAGSGTAASPGLRVAVSRDGKRVATGHADGTVRLWHLAADGQLTPDGEELPITRDGAVTSLGLGREDRTLLAVSPGAGKLCDLSTRGRHHDFLTGPLTAGALAPDGRTVALVLGGGAVQLCELPSWRVRQPHGQYVNRIDSLVFSADGRTVVTAGAVRQIRVQNRGLVAAETEPLRSTADTLRFWDAATGEEAPSAVTARETMTPPTVVARSPDGRLLAAGAEDGSVWVWDWPKKGQWPTRLFVSEKARVYAQTAELARRTWTNSRPKFDSNGEAVRALAFAPDGRGLAAAGNRGSVRVWETDGWTECGRWSGALDGSPWLAFTSDGGGVAGSRGGQVCVWEVMTGEVRAALGEEADPPVLCGVFAPGQDVLAVGTKDGAIRLWDTFGGGAKRLPGGHQDRVTSLAFTPDGRTLASGGWDHTVRLWNLAAGREVAALEGHRGRVHAVAFSPDGTVLAGGGEGEVLFWRR
jgi:WD40 repeat protein